MTRQFWYNNHSRAKTIEDSIVLQDARCNGEKARTLGESAVAREENSYNAPTDARDVLRDPEQKTEAGSILLSARSVSRQMIAKAQAQKVPYMIVLGDKEVENGTISVRERTEGDQGTWPVEQMVELLRDAVV